MRTLLLLFFSVFTSNLVFTQQEVLRPGSDWPKFLGPSGNSHSPETGILTRWPESGLKKVWECTLGVGYAPPTVVQGKIYLFDRHADRARLTCRNASTGESIWTYEYPTTYEDLYGYDPGPRACPLVDGDRVYLHGVEGMLVCVNADDGKERWKVDTRAQYRFHQNFFGVGSVPLVHGDLLIVAIGGSPPGPRPVDLRDAKPNGSCLVAFDKRTGIEKYRLGDDLASYSSPMIATLGGKPTGLYFARGGLIGFDPEQGAVKFHFPWRARKHDSVNAANPLVVGDRILITECYEKGAVLLDLSSGKPNVIWTDDTRDWSEKALASHWCTPVAINGYVYGCSGQHANQADIRCLDLATGEVKWIERRTTRSTLLAIDGHILSLGEQGQARLFRANPERYEEVARWDVPGIGYPAWAPPVVSRGLLYLRGKDEESRTGHKLFCFELIPEKK